MPKMIQQMGTKMNPCPCGSTIINITEGDQGGVFEIWCTKCPMLVRMPANLATVVYAWNRATSMPKRVAVQGR